MNNTIELVLPRSQEESKKASSAARRGHYTKVRQGVYVTSGDPEAVRTIVLDNWQRLVEELSPEGSVLAFRTAADLRPEEGEVFVISPVKYRRQVPVGDYLLIHILPGDTEHGIHPLNVNYSLQMSGEARKCLENLTRTSNRRQGVNKSLGAEWVENYLARLVNRTGEDAVNAIRDEARTLAPQLGLEREFEQLNALVTAILTTHEMPDSVLTGDLALATARGEPFDAAVLQRFEELAAYLTRCELEAAPLDYGKAAWRNASFVEAYFSNYIEGTEFTLEEAEDIVFERKVNHDRPADSHDVLATFDLTSDRQELLRTPTSADEFLELLQVRHLQLMRARPESNPGQFKTRHNRAGGTDFVSPDNLIGTLTRAFPLYEDLAEGLERALFIHFVNAECHPMTDGNGREARIFMNAELYSAGLAKVIVPTVHRDSYLIGMRRASRENTFRTMVKALHQMHLYSASLPWDDYGELRETLAQHQAAAEPDQGVATFNRVIRVFNRDYPLDRRIAGGDLPPGE